MVLIIFGLVVPMSVLTQLLAATLWKAFCFLSETPVLMPPVVNSHKLRIALSGVRNKSWASAFSCCFSFLFFSFYLFLPSSPCTHRHSAFVITCSPFVISCSQILKLSSSAPLSCWAHTPGVWEPRWHVLPRGAEKGDGAGRWVMWMVKKGAADLTAPNPRFLPLVKQRLLVTAAAWRRDAPRSDVMALGPGSAGCSALCGFGLKSRKTPRLSFPHWKFKVCLQWLAAGSLLTQEANPARDWISL